MKENEGIHRHDISDEAWERIKDLLPGQAGKRGGVAKDNRLFINAVAWQTSTGLRGGIYRQNSGTGTAYTSGFAAGGIREYGERWRIPQ
ncbi:transposase [Treponema endosymbiont of Eucomonympha sp.]|uniref:transposase n=1 Tax=Treponema endosymbiont of Eucomonympha sp. TaxID=1580831 RepID=UPI0007857EDA|nr:transposase [Treponema endosymbiont of Eucomonympha sp.]